MYKPHQIAASEAAVKLLNQHGMAALFGLPRTGKTRTALRAASLYGANNVLVLTKKAAIGGWRSEISATQPHFGIHVINYEQVKHLKDKYDFLILDESHNLGSRGKPTQRVKAIRALAYNLPALFLTGTPTIETPLGIYHQWCVTKHSPFDEFKNFYKFFRVYGVPNPIWLNGRQVEQYKEHRPELDGIIEKYAVRVSQDDAGIKHQAQDVVHTVPLSKKTKARLKELEEHGVVGKYVYDTDMGVRTALHQLESGTLLYEDEYIMLKNTEVVDYIRDTFGDSPDVALFAHFKSTRKKLRQHLKRAQIFSSIAHSEGVDMSHMKHMVIVNTGYSGAKAAQLRERVVNMNRTTEALVHHIVTDAGISRDVYNAVSKKVDYNLRAFRDRRA